jgi:hypothetical protein
MRQVVMENGVKAWPFSSSQYVQEAVNNAHKRLTVNRETRNFHPKLTGAAIKKMMTGPKLTKLIGSVPLMLRYLLRVINRIPVMVPLTAPLLGVHFSGGIFPSKIDTKNFY